MNRWLPVLIGVILALSTVAAFRNHIKSEAKKKREAVYESTLQAYSQNLKPGWTRKAVEDYLRTNNTFFTQICCIKERSALADLVKIGEEDAPWYCSEHWVHIAFEYAAVEQHDSVKANGTDILKTIMIFHEWGRALWRGNCMRTRLCTSVRRTPSLNLNGYSSMLWLCFARTNKSTEP